MISIKEQRAISLKSRTKEETEEKEEEIRNMTNK